MTAPTNGQGRTASLARNRYQEGQILRARDLERESDYFLARDRQHNALAHGPGILIGLQLVAYKAGTETPVTEAVLFTPLPQPLDLYITRGAAIDSGGRLIIVPKRVPVRLDLASVPSVLDAGMYRLELLYQAEESGRGGRNGSSCEADLPGVLEEGYRLRLTEYDPSDPLPELDLGAVLDGPVDDPRVPAPIILGLVEWSGTAYDGYSTGIRRYASVRAQRVRAPDDRSEVELRDRNNRFTVRFAAPPGADPFTPGKMEDRFRIDSDGSVWVPAEVGVGPEGLRFRIDNDPTAPEDSKWRALTAVRTPGAEFGMNDATPLPARLKDEEYTSGPRELQILFQREGSNLGRHRVVIGHVDDIGGDFKPALVVYDRPPGAGGTGSATVEVWGDLYVRGTAFMYAAARRPPTSGTGLDELDLLLHQLAGPFAGAFRVFLTSDPTWLTEFADVMAKQVAQTGPVRTKFVDAIVADPNFVNAVTNAVIPQAVAQAVPQAVAAVQSAANLPGLVTALLANAPFTTALATAAVAAVQNPVNLPGLATALLANAPFTSALATAAVAAVQNGTNLPGLISAVTNLLDDQSGNPATLPADRTRRLVAAIYRRLLTNFQDSHDQIRDSVPAGIMRTKVEDALAWLV